MKKHRIAPSRAPGSDTCVPAHLLTWLQPFQAHFPAPTWDRVLILVMGAVLTPGKRTVTAALRIMGLATASNFTCFHQVLNRARWSALAVARCLLTLIVTTFVSDGPVVIGLDDTIERRWGPKITKRGIYRDAVRSSKGHFVKTSGLRWLSFMVLAPIPWAKRVWALPFLTILAPSKRYNTQHGRSHKRLTDWARQGILRICRWLPDRRLLFIGDSGFAALELLAAVVDHCAVISRLRLDANLFAPPPERKPGKRGAPAKKGNRLPKLSHALEAAETTWQTVTIKGWYGEATRTLEITTDVGLWYKNGVTPVTLRWVLVRDPLGKRSPQAFFSTDTTLAAETILQLFVRRWQVEVTFAEVRGHLGVETQRQRSDLAILRITPAFLGLCSLVTLWATALFKTGAQSRQATWYIKTDLTFSDAIAAVRYSLWLPQIMSTSPLDMKPEKIPPDTAKRMAEALCYAT